MGQDTPKGKSKCNRCGGSGTEFEEWYEPGGPGGSASQVKRSRQVQCKVCNGSGYQ